MGKLSFRVLLGIWEHAAEHAGELVEAMGLLEAPVDPFDIIVREPQLYAEGADFRDALHGRLNYVGPRFCLAYNTRYNEWPHRGAHHPKVRFSVAHELGHFYLDEHRQYLLSGGKPHCSFTEFETPAQREREADYFAAGLLMPKQLFLPAVNEEPFPSVKHLKDVRDQCQVSLTGMLVRWAQLSDFPCATIAVRRTSIVWGFVSEGYRRAGAYRVRRDALVRSKDCREFVDKQPVRQFYCEGLGAGAADQWLDWDRRGVSTEEHYFAIPYSEMVLVFIASDEDDVAGSGSSGDDW